MPVAPALLGLCAQATPSTFPVQGLEATLFHRYGHLATVTSFAYYRYWLDVGEAPTAPVLCADPVSLHSGIDQVLLKADLPQLAPDEVQSVLALLNPHLAQDDLQLLAPHPQRWYLQGESIADRALRTVPLSQVRGQSIFPHLPQGDKRYWHRLLNEIQMLLHSAGTAANGLWLWGEASPNVAGLAQRGIHTGFIGSSTTAQVMALATQQPYYPATTLAGDDGVGCYGIVLEDLLLSAANDDYQSWQQVLQRLEADWFAPALAGMRKGKYQVRLTACDGRFWHCQAPPRWQFWKKPQATWARFSSLLP